MVQTEPSMTSRPGKIYSLADVEVNICPFERLGHLLRKNLQIWGTLMGGDLVMIWLI
jgi:hypothetical protein